MLDMTQERFTDEQAESIDRVIAVLETEGTLHGAMLLLEWARELTQIRNYEWADPELERFMEELDLREAQRL